MGGRFYLVIALDAKGREVWRERVRAGTRNGAVDNAKAGRATRGEPPAGATQFEIRPVKGPCLR